MEFQLLSPIRFEESVVEALILELGKASRNGMIYTWDESFAKSFVGKSVYYGLKCEGNICGLHDTAKSAKVGTIESIRRVGNKVIARLNIFKESLLQEIKNGVKFYFSVSGKGLGQTLKDGTTKLIGGVLKSLQIFKENLAGFRTTKVLGFSESVLYIREDEQYDIIIGKGIKEIEFYT